MRGGECKLDACFLTFSHFFKKIAFLIFTVNKELLREARLTNVRACDILKWFKKKRMQEGRQKKDAKKRAVSAS